MAWVKPPKDEVRITEHFSWTELCCRCCGEVPAVRIVRETADWLENLRHEVYGDRPMHITSGCRCPAHNARVGGAPDSYHMRGMAVDFVVRGLTAYGAWGKAEKAQDRGLIGGLGRYKSWVHADWGPKRSWEGP